VTVDFVITTYVACDPKRVQDLKILNFFYTPVNPFSTQSQNQHRARELTHTVVLFETLFVLINVVQTPVDPLVLNNVVLNTVV